MPNKFHRQNLRMGSNPFGRKSNLAKIAEVFGPKKKNKKIKKPTKRMFANKGGGADMGKMGELKSKLAVAGMKAKDVMGKSTEGLTKEQIERLKEILKSKGNFMKPLRKIENPEAKPMRNLIQLLLGFIAAFLGFVIAMKLNFVVGLLICFGGMMAVMLAIPDHKDREAK